MTRTGDFSAVTILLELVAGASVLLTTGCLADEFWKQLTTISPSNENSSSVETIRIGYISDLDDPTVRVRAIEEAIERATSKGILPGYNFRLTTV